jgi:hypothetical protein
MASTSSIASRFVSVALMCVSAAVAFGASQHSDASALPPLAPAPLARTTAGAAARCQTALGADCGAARKSGSAACLVCAGQHQHDLRAARCSNAVIGEYCHSGGGAAAPGTKFAVGFNNANCEAHPHAGIQLADGGWLMVGDSVCWDGSTPAIQRMVFVVVSDSDGKQRWSTRLGDIGFNYGKAGTQLQDGTVVVGGAKSVVDPDAQKAGYAYIEVRALWRLDVNTGEVLSENLYPNDGKMTGLRDGVMCVNPTTDGTNGLVATGYVGGEANYDKKTNQYDDEPMFLIFNGVAFGARLTFSSDLAAPPDVEFEVKLGLDESYGYVPMQGMRVHMDTSGSVAISAASCSGPYDDAWDMQFSLLSLNAETGKLQWAKRYVTGLASHPYGLALSAPGDATPGYVIAGHSMEDGRQPIGRLLKVRASDGAVVWDRSFTDRDERYYNIECYGVDATLDGGYIVTCGDGPMDIPAWMKKDCHEQAWTAFVYRADQSGQPLWTANVTDSTAKCVSDAGEHIVTARGGGYAVYVDSGTLGQPGTGGNFGLVVLDSDTSKAL